MIEYKLSKDKKQLKLNSRPLVYNLIKESQYFKHSRCMKSAFRMKPINHMERYAHDNFRDLADMNSELILSFTNYKSDYLCRKFLPNIFKI